MIIPKALGVFLDLIPFWLITGKGSVGRVGRSLGFLGIGNQQDLMPYHLLTDGNHIPETTFHITWLGLVHKYKGDHPYCIPPSRKPITEWLILPPKSLSIKRVLPVML